jgi:hypothetical protein
MRHDPMVVHVLVSRGEVRIEVSFPVIQLNHPIGPVTFGCPG